MTSVSKVSIIVLIALFACVQTVAGVDCSGYGAKDASGVCKCYIGSTGADCSACAAGYSGSPCKATATLAYRLNQVQIIDVHNAYHTVADGADPPLYFSRKSPPLCDLYLAGVNGFEIDVAAPKADGTFPVYHIPIIDQASTCPDFGACLTKLISCLPPKTTGYAPIFIHIEAKDGGFSAVEWASLEKIVTDLIPRANIFTPGDLMGTYPTLQAAISANPATAWPLISAMSQKWMFWLDVPAATYGGKLFFQAYSFANRAQGAFVKFNTVGDSEAALAEIRTAVNEGYLVRVMSDTYESLLPRETSAQVAQKITLMFPKGDELTAFFGALIVSLGYGALSSSIPLVLGACGVTATSVTAASQILCVDGVVVSKGVPSFLGGLATPGPISAYNATRLANVARASGANILTTDFPTKLSAGGQAINWVSPHISATASVRCSPDYPLCTDAAVNTFAVPPSSSSANTIAPSLLFFASATIALLAVAGQTLGF